MGLNIIIVIVLCFVSVVTYSQESKSGPIIVCPAEFTPNEYKVLAPKWINENSNRSLNSNSATFEVEYIGFSNEAKEAFQYAVAIWESILKTDVKIRVRASWESLGTGVLGSASANSLYRNFENAPLLNTWYPVALAEKLSKSELNGEGEYDIIASFNSDFDNWYYGKDGAGINKFDLVTVVLHELGHGLGFISGDNYHEDGTANWDLQETGFPMIYTSYLHNGEGVNIVDLNNGSKELGRFLTSRDVFIDKDLVNKLNSGPAKVFAPGTYDHGSSISHWDEATYNDSENALMTPSVAPSEVLHSPGPLTLGLFAEMGWFKTSITHDPVLVIDRQAKVDFEISVVSDTALFDNDFRIVYYYEGSDSASINLESDKKNIYHASLDIDSTQSELYYYFEGLSDALGKSYRIPEHGTYRSIITSIPILQVPFEASSGGDFEGDNVGFVGTSAYAVDELWQRGVAAFTKFKQYESQAWMTSLSNKVSKPDVNTDYDLVSPLFDLGAANKDYVLSFDFISQFSENDFTAMYYSLDSGVHWAKLGKAGDGLGKNWYSKLDHGDYFGLDNSLLAGGQIELKHAEYPLHELAGNIVMFKLTHTVLSGGSTYGNDGFLIDNFGISATDPRARFYSPDTTFNFPENPIHFYYASSGALSYLWDFGDGHTSNEPDPVHYYESGGSFSVSLTITHPNGEDSFIRENYITVLSQKGTSYTLEEGGDFERDNGDFIPVNVSGTPFQRGESFVPSKNGTNSGNNAWVTGLAEETYENESEAYLFTPEFTFDLIGNYQLSFFAKYAFENLWDGFIVEYTLDRGISWIKLDSEVRSDWYDDLSDENAVFGPRTAIFTGNTNGVFVRKSSDVSFLSGEDAVTFRFTFLSDPLEVDAGLAIDDFELNGPQDGSIEVNLASDLVSGIEGCTGSIYNFVNRSSGSVRSLSWFFGQDATPSQGSGPGPYTVEFHEPGEYKVVLTASDGDGTVVSDDTLLNISEIHAPTITQEGDGAVVSLVASEGERYQWYLDHQILEGENSKILEANRTGSYAVAVTVGFCTVITEDINIVAASKNVNGLMIYPNPTSRRLDIDLSEQNIDFVSILDLNGRVLLRRKVNRNDRILSIAIKDFLEKGIYVLELSSKSNSSVQRFIVE